MAIKILPEAFAADENRVARLQREAQTLAALNHPHIAAIYWLEEGPAQAGRHPFMALVMELVEGTVRSARMLSLLSLWDSSSCGRLTTN